MTEELSLLAVIVILFLADLFLCGKDEKELSACTSLSSCGCNFRTAFPVILLLVHTALNLLPCCNGSLEPATAFGGMYQHTPMMTIVKSVLNIGVIVVFLMSSEMARQRRKSHQDGRVPHRGALHSPRHVFHDFQRPFHHVLHRPRISFHSYGCPRRLRQEEARKRRSWRQVHPSRPLLKRPLALWHLAHLRRDWNTLFR